MQRNYKLRNYNPNVLNISIFNFRPEAGMLIVMCSQEKTQKHWHKYDIIQTKLNQVWWKKYSAEHGELEKDDLYMPLVQIKP